MDKPLLIGTETTRLAIVWTIFWEKTKHASKLTTELMFSLLRSMARTLLIKLPTRGSRGEEESRKDQRSCNRDSLELSFSTIV